MQMALHVIRQENPCLFSKSMEGMTSLFSMPEETEREDSCLQLRAGRSNALSTFVCSLKDRLDSWVQRNGCTNRQQEDTFDGKVHHISWTCNGQQGALQHYKVDDMGK